MGKCTLKDLALACNVSAYTASRAINNKPDISEKTKAIILNKAKEMGYVVDMNAKALRSGKSYVVSLVYDNFENPYYNLLVKQFAFKLMQQGYKIQIHYDFNSTAVLNTQSLKSACSTNCDGIISFVDVTNNAVNFARQNGIPLIQLGIATDNEELNCISLDDADGAYVLTKHFIDIGCQKFCFCLANGYHKPSFQRALGFKKCLLENLGYVPKDSCLTLTDFNEPSEIVDYIRDKKFDCVLCFNDSDAFRIRKECIIRGLTNIKFGGFDNISPCLPLVDGIPSVSVDTNLLVDEAIALLFDLMQNPSQEAVHKVLPLKLFKN